MTQRMIPPNGGTTTLVNGRSYTAAAASYVDAPDWDASELEANGWLRAAFSGVGTTAQRPTAQPKGVTYHDTTLGYNILFNGVVWVNPTSGATV